jgi:hypothetical protein
MCLEVPEEDWHLFFECEYNKEAWTVMGIDQILQTRVHMVHNDEDLILDICYNENKYDAGKMVVLMWNMW